MSNDEDDRRIAVVDGGSSVGRFRRMEEQAREAQRRAEASMDSEMAEMKEDDLDQLAGPHVEIHSDKTREMAQILTALEVNGIQVRPPKPPAKQPKEVPSQKEQERRMAAAQAKRKRKMQRRLLKGT